MSEFEKYVTTLIKNDVELITREAQPYLQLIQEYYDTLKAVKEASARCKQSGKKLSIDELRTILYGTDNTATNTEQTSLKENVPPPELTPPPTNGRPKRAAFEKASLSITGHAKQSIVPKNARKENTNVCIKSEKLSIDASTINLQEVNANVKQEREEMPAPKWLPPRKKKQKNAQTDIEVKQEKLDEYEKSNETRKDSDVILQEIPVPVIDVSEEPPLLEPTNFQPSKSAINSPPSVEGRVTRTKTREKNKESSKRPRVDTSVDKSQTSKKRSKSSNESQKEEVDCINATFVKSKGPEPMQTENVEVEAVNATVVVQFPKFAANEFPSDLMTDDESEDELKRDAVKKNPVNHPLIKPSKQVFSPFDQSPVKKKVEAFEKLGIPAELPPRQTRTKTRAQLKEQEATENGNPPIEKPPANLGLVKEKAKLFTPVISKFHPSSCSTSKTTKAYPSQLETSSLPKAPKTDFVEKEKLRKEAEALRKRELQAQIEKKKRNREEKQLKAQQQREALEKEKLKVIEQQKRRDEKHKQMLMEQEEKKQKQREELERKRLQAKKKAAEEKKREDERRLEEERKLDEINAHLIKQEAQIAKQLLQKQAKQRLQQKLPVYKLTQAPRLPTHDCYDSEEEEYPNTNHARNEPKWARGDALKNMQMCIKYAGEKIKNTYFSRQAMTPDLEEIFEVIDPKLLKRNSSAIWHTAPKYSLMPAHLDSHIEDSDE